MIAVHHIQPHRRIAPRRGLGFNRLHQSRANPKPARGLGNADAVQQEMLRRRIITQHPQQRQPPRRPNRPINSAHIGHLAARKAALIGLEPRHAQKRTLIIQGHDRMIAAQHPANESPRFDASGPITLPSLLPKACQ